MIIQPSLYTLLLFLSVKNAYNFLGTASTWAKLTIKCIKRLISKVVYVHSMYASLVLNIAQYCRGKDDPVTWYEGTEGK
jgi:hypothetical protein